MLGRHDKSAKSVGLAKKLRKESTEAERKLWALLRNKRLSGFRFRRQHPAAGYILDFVCLKSNLVVELDGDRHAEPRAVEADVVRTRALNRVGLRVVRIPTFEMLRDPDAVVDTIYRELTSSVFFPSSP